MSLLTVIDDFDLLEDPFEGVDISALVSSLTLVSHIRVAARFTTPFEIKFTPYSISTMTMLSGLDTRVDIDLIFGHITCDPMSIVNARMSCVKFRGFYVPKKRKTPKKVFLNQITFDVSISSFRKISVKLFRDGNLQLAGCKSEPEAHVALSKLAQALEGIKDIKQPGHIALLLSEEEHCRVYESMGSMEEDTFREYLYKFKGRKPHRDKAWRLYDIPCMKKAVETSKALQTRPPTVVMINSDFDAGLPISKEAFVNYLRDEHGVFCRPFCSNHPGANIKYTSNADCVHGCKTLEEKVTCNALRKRKKRANACVTVTILAFSTGKIVLTGSRSTNQLDEVYLFLKHVFETGYDRFGLHRP